jgi:hypothetical protein
MLRHGAPALTRGLQLPDETALKIPTSLTSLRHTEAVCAKRTITREVGEADAFALRGPHSMGPKKRELVRAFAVGLERLPPQRLGLLVRTIRVTRRTAKVSGAASMNDHRVVPRGKTMYQTACFTSADCIRN